jgi:hypothetical protein
MRNIPCENEVPAGTAKRPWSSGIRSSGEGVMNHMAKPVWLSVLPVMITVTLVAVGYALVSMSMLLDPAGPGPV